MTKEELREKANDLPLLPGVYLMMDKTGKVIYVGKAKKLKNRVSQYFQDTASHNEKTRAMVSQVDHFDTIFVSSEFEALILENSLIKRHQPRYNILLKDDKGYPYIRLSGEEYPRFSLAGKVAEDGARYFGPYASRKNTQAIIDALRTALRQARKDRFVLPVQHVEPAVPVEAALVVLIEAFEGVFDAREVRNTPVDSLEQVEHRQERAVEGGDVVIIERQSGCGRSDGFAIFDQLLNTADLRERRSHGADTPGPDFGGMGGKFRALPQATAAHVHDHLEPGGHRGDPLFGQRHPFFGGEHVTLA